MQSTGIGNGLRVIVEGADGSGKSTFAETVLKPTLGRKVFHAGGPPTDSESMWKRIYGTDWDCIQDRWTPISELVYGHTLRGHTLIPETVLYSLLVSINPLVFYCRPPMDTCLGNREEIIRRAEEKQHKTADWVEQVLSRHAEIISRYDFVISRMIKTGVHVVQYDYTGAYEK